MLLRCRILLLSSVIFLLMLFIVGCSKKDDSKPIELTYAHIHNPGHSLYLAAEDYKKLVEEKSGGKIIVNLFPSSQLGSARDMMEQVRIGTLDITHAATSDWAAGLNLPDLGVYDLPFLYPNVEAQNAVIKELVRDDINERLKDQPVIFVHAYSNGIRNYISPVKPVNSLEDIKGLKMRTAENPQYVQLWQALKANVVTSAWSEAYTVVQTGVADAAEADAVGLVAINLPEISKYYSKTSHIGNIYIALFNKDKWNSLSPEYQKILMEASEESMNNQLNARVAQDQAAEQKIRDAGVKFNDVSASERQKMLDATSKIYEDFSTKYGVGDYIDKLLEFTKNYY